MKLVIHTRLDYRLACPTDILLQVEAAHIPEQPVETANLVLSDCAHFARIASHDTIGERIWLRAEDRLTVDYRATVAIDRLLGDCATLAAVPFHQLPGETVQYLMASRYCPSDQFEKFVQAEFGGLEGGARIAAIRDWIGKDFSYVLGSSNGSTTALETFVRREGVCRDYAHVLITLARASGIPARMASVYAPGVDPPDFHAVAEVFLDGAWHLVDATGMATEAEMAKIGIGRDAADIAFITAYGDVELIEKEVEVQAA